MMRTRGFTLLEMLVVLSIMAFVAGVVLPGLQRIYERTERGLARNGLVAQIAGLGYRAYVLGENIELDDKTLTSMLSDGEPEVSVPDGWKVRIAQPVHYAFNGLCGGGNVVLIDPDGVKQAYRLDAPRCEPNEVLGG